MKNYITRSGGVEFGLVTPAKMLIYCVQTPLLCVGAPSPNLPGQRFAADIFQSFPKFICFLRRVFIWWRQVVLFVSSWFFIVDLA